MKGLLALLYMFEAIADAYLTAQKKQREIDREEQNRAIRAQRIQQEHNRTVITDIEVEQIAIELKRRELDLRERELDILKKERALGLNGVEFKPENYS